MNLYPNIAKLLEYLVKQVAETKGKNIRDQRSGGGASVRGRGYYQLVDAVSDLGKGNLNIKEESSPFCVKASTWKKAKNSLCQRPGGGASVSWYVTWSMLFLTLKKVI